MKEIDEIRDKVSNGEMDINEAFWRVLDLLAVSSSADVDNGNGLCKEKNCKSYATKDYNGHEHWVCDYHYNKLNDEFDEEYR